MHRQDYYRIGHFLGIGQQLGFCAFQAFVLSELAYHWLEIASPEDVLLLHLEIVHVAGHTVVFCIHKIREV